ncbi:MAG: hypothetical protein IKC89_00435 [Lentisphaeria bacterium]|nr:hypothetical protein [Lentisphaeria bacterium]
MGANTEYAEYWLTDSGWKLGKQKFIGEPVIPSKLTDEVTQNCYKRIRIVSEMRTGGSLAGARHVDVIYYKKGYEAKINELLEKYPENELF